MTAGLALQELETVSGNGRSFGMEGGSRFGDVGSYAPCGCCGGFHAVFEEGGGPLGFINADDRGGVDSNGKVSLTPGGAGSQITRSNVTWGTALGQAATVSFAFRSTAPGTMPDDTTGFTRFTQVQIAATLLALASWSEVANITFTRVNDGDGFSDSAVILFGNYSSGADGAAAFAYMPRNTSLTSNSGDVWINSTLTYNATPIILGYGQQVLTHEIGHAIGLSHPSAYNAGPDQILTYANNASYYEDSRQYTIMSYFSEANTGGRFGSGRYSAAPLMDDIAAAQRLYGANMTTRTGATTYGFNANAGQTWFSATSATSILIFAAWDAGGIDTFDFSGYGNAQVIDLRQGAFSNVGALIGNVSIAVGAVIENAIGGSGADILYGNAGDNVLTGAAGNDRIDGGLGSDTVVFSGARSQYTITYNGALATVVGPDGTDTLSNVEVLRFTDQTVAAAFTGGLNVSGDITTNTLTGGDFGDTLNGLGGDDTLSGLAGNDLLDGGSGNDNISGGDGQDILIGGLGDDVLNGGAGFDQASYAGATGSVTVNLTTGVASGAAGPDTLVGIEWVVGGAFADTLTGSAGNDRLDGAGGNDTIRGGDGDDVITAGAGAQTGGAPDFVKPGTTANNTAALAVQLDGAFDLLARTDVANSTTIPHATVIATTHGGIEFYAFTVAAGQSITLDIDNGSFDTTLRLLGPDGAELATNDDSTPDGGPTTDSQLTFTATTTGVYYAIVNEWEANSGTTFTSRAPAAGETYTLHVSVTGHSVVPLTLTGSSLYGDAGNDTLIGGSAGDLLVGGAGVDSVVYSGVRRQYTANSTAVSGGSDGSDTLVGIENAVFVDGILTFDATTASAQVMRLYSAALNRTPDQAGLEANVAALSTMALSELATNFSDSAEFQQRFGALSNQAYVEQLYRFALGREGDTAGVSGWTSMLNGGATRGAVLLGFSESLENQGRTAGALAAGLWIPDAEAKIIARLYDATLDRLPDPAGLAGWGAAYDSGTSLLQITAAFVGSAEFQQRYGALSDQQFVEQLYRFCLNREGDAQGISGWLSLMNGGLSRAQVVIGFSESVEHIALMEPFWLGGVRYQGYVGGALEDMNGKDGGAQTSPLIDDAPAIDVASVDAGEIARAGLDDTAQILPMSDDFLIPVGHDAIAMDPEIAAALDVPTDRAIQMQDLVSAPVILDAALIASLPESHVHNEQRIVNDWM